MTAKKKVGVGLALSDAKDEQGERRRGPAPERHCPFGHSVAALKFLLKNGTAVSWWPACGCVKYDTSECGYVNQEKEGTGTHRESSSVDPTKASEECKDGAHVVRKHHLAPADALDAEEEPEPNGRDPLPQLKAVNEKPRWLLWCVECGAILRPGDKAWVAASG